MTTIDIPNINETHNGIKYAYEPEGECDTNYIAECVEYGEHFLTEFYAPSNYTSEQLYSIGEELAMTWGAQCISIMQVTKKNKNGSVTGYKIERK